MATPVTTPRQLLLSRLISAQRVAAEAASLGFPSLFALLGQSCELQMSWTLSGGSELGSEGLPDLGQWQGKVVWQVQSGLLVGGSRQHDRPDLGGERRGREERGGWAAWRA